MMNENAVMTKRLSVNAESGFSLVELLTVMTTILILLGSAMSLFSGAIKTKMREGRRTDALVSARTALNLISSEVANSGYGVFKDKLPYNGISPTDSNSQRIHFRANLQNTNSVFDDEGEDVTYFFDKATQSILRYDANSETPTSVVVNQISTVNFQYFNYVGANSTPTEVATPDVNTARIRITVTVKLEAIANQPSNQTVTLTSEVVLRNSRYMLNQY